MSALQVSEVLTSTDRRFYFYSWFADQGTQHTMSWILNYADSCIHAKLLLVFMKWPHVSAETVK